LHIVLPHGRGSGDTIWVCIRPGASWEVPIGKNKRKRREVTKRTFLNGTDYGIRGGDITIVLQRGWDRLSALKEDGRASPVRQITKGAKSTEGEQEEGGGKIGVRLPEVSFPVYHREAENEKRMNPQIGQVATVLTISRV